MMSPLRGEESVPGPCNRVGMTLGTSTQKADERSAGVAATGTPRIEPDRRPAPAPSQRDLVRASLLRCPPR